MRTAITLTPDDFVLPWFGLAQMYYERKEFTKAASYLEKANKAYPENVEILSLLGDVYGKLGNKDEAVVLLRRVVELEPGNAEALIGTAELLHASLERKDQIIAISSYIAVEKVMKQCLGACTYGSVRKPRCASATCGQDC